MVSLQSVPDTPHKANHHHAVREAVDCGEVRHVNVKALFGVATDMINELDKVLNLSASQFLNL